MNAQERLQAGKTATHKGRFEEALSQFVWFHEHALEEDRAYYGVRLSFALGYWLELAEQYPPALAAFRARRDDKLARLSVDELDRDLFHDIEAMNRGLGEDERTAELFAVLDEHHPEFARQCAGIAVSALVRVKRFTLAAKYMPEPLPKILSLADKTTREVGEISARPRTKEPRYLVRVRVFAAELLQFEEILHATESAESAAQLRLQALTALKPAYLRNAVAKLLAQSPVPR